MRASATTMGAFDVVSIRSAIRVRVIAAVMDVFQKWDVRRVTTFTDAMYTLFDGVMADLHVTFDAPGAPTKPSLEDMIGFADDVYITTRAAMMVMMEQHARIKRCDRISIDCSAHIVASSVIDAMFAA